MVLAAAGLRRLGYLTRDESDGPKDTVVKTYKPRSLIIR